MGEAMTERITITGSDLKIDHTRPEAGTPIRPRPAPYQQPATTGRDLKLFVGGPNPYWTAEANEAAENSKENPKTLAKRWRKHRIENPHET